MPARLPYKHCAIIAGLSLLMLAGCSKVPDWAKPETLYGKVFSEAEERLGDDLKTDDKAIPVFSFFKDKESDDLDHVYDELSGDLENRNHQDTTLKGGGSVKLPEKPPASQIAETEKQETSDDAKPNHAFPGLSGNF